MKTIETIKKMITYPGADWEDGIIEFERIPGELPRRIKVEGEYDYVGVFPAKELYVYESKKGGYEKVVIYLKKELACFDGIEYNFELKALNES